MKKHLTEYEREKIFKYLERGESQRNIGRILGRDHRTIGRELKRNPGLFGAYSPVLAQKAAREREKISNSKRSRKNPRILRYVKDKLELDWSPEQIAGRMEVDFPDSEDFCICHETIYNHIYRRENRNLGLWVHLRRSRPRRMKRHERKPQKEIIQGRIFIDNRPDCINQRAEVGHWESDLVLGRQKDKEAISVTVERKVKYIIFAF